ncbi:MAG: sugar phosphate isomerase/epimerase [Candidatus Eremiobacteraeota bacterium]|nr:sugar phosphate isomerase/epimerase [Candidatus Eremiobacteraeota bacterium]MBV8332830.1 sugar phosphate isomerase/epimerase [Candidatus Eremiobacteraeota bacterium]
MKLAYTIGTPEVKRMPMAWLGEPEPILEKLAVMGYDGVELQTRNPAEFDADAFGKKVKDAGLAICAVSSGVVGETDGIYLMSPEPEKRKAAIERYKSIIDLAARYGVDSSIGRMRGQAKWAPDRKTGLGWFRAALEELCSYAQGKGVKIVLEPQHPYNLDTLNSLAETVEFIRSFAATNLVFEADIHHQGLVEKSIPAALVFGMQSGYMTFVQVSDGNRLPPGLGIFNWVDVFETLKAVGYDGWISVECKQFPDSERCASYCYQYLSTIMSLPEVP